MQQKKVVWIVSMSYSGSSLLNVLLDTQPTIRGVGEGAQVYTDRLGGGPCTACQSAVKRCSLYSRWNGESFYRFNFEHYGCSTLVDSSKSVRLLSAIPREPYDYRAVCLSKTPREAVYSLWKHHRKRTSARTATIPDCFSYYIRATRVKLRDLKASGVPYVHVHYRDLAADRLREIRRLTDWLDEPFDEERLLGDWHETDTHVLGGNPAIIMQVTKDARLAFGNRDYLDGKYANRLGEVFLDRAWADDEAFLERCRFEYRAHEDELRRLMPRLGYDYDLLLTELDGDVQPSPTS